MMNSDEYEMTHFQSKQIVFREVTCSMHEIFLERSCKKRYKSCTQLISKFESGLIVEHGP